MGHRDVFHPPVLWGGGREVSHIGSLGIPTERKILKNLCLGKYDLYFRFPSIIKEDIEEEWRIIMVEKLERLLQAIKAMIQSFKGVTGDNEALIKTLREEKKALIVDKNLQQKLAVADKDALIESTAALEELEKEKLAALALIEEIEAELKKA